MNISRLMDEKFELKCAIEHYKINGINDFTELRIVLKLQDRLIEVITQLNELLTDKQAA